MMSVLLVLFFLSKLCWKAQRRGVPAPGTFGDLGVDVVSSRLVGTWNSSCNLNATFFWGGRNIQLGEHRIMWPDFPEHGSSIVWIQPGFLTILSDPKIDGQVHAPVWYLVSSCNAQPSSSGGFFRVRKSCTMKFGKTKGFGQASSSGDTTEVFQHNESLLPHLLAKKLSWSWGTWSIYFHANLVVFFVFFVIFGDTVEQNSAHQLIYQNKFMKCRQLHPQKFTRNMQKEP